MATGSDSYNNQRFNYNKLLAQIYPRIPTFPTINYIDTVSFDIEGYRIQNDPDNILCRTKDVSGVSIPNKWIGDLSIAKIDNINLKFGIIDQLSEVAEPRIADRFLLLFALWDYKCLSAIPDGKADEYSSSFIGYGLFNQPKCNANLTSANKGTETIATLTGTTDGRAYQFTVGANVLLYYDTENWNTGRIMGISSQTTMKIQVDNYTYGTNIGSETFTIVQLDKFRPYDISNNNKNLYDQYQLLTGCIRLDVNSEVVPFDYKQGYITYKDMIQYFGETGLKDSTFLYLSMFDFCPPTAISVRGRCVNLGGHAYLGQCRGDNDLMQNIDPNSVGMYIEYFLPENPLVYRCYLVNTKDGFYNYFNGCTELLF